MFLKRLKFNIQFFADNKPEEFSEDYKKGQTDAFAKILEMTGLSTIEEIVEIVKSPKKEEEVTEEPETVVEDEVENETSEEENTEVEEENEVVEETVETEEDNNVVLSEEDTVENSEHEETESENLEDIKAERDMLRAEKTALKAGITPDYVEDLVSLVKGQGLELNEANISLVAEKHPEWKNNTTGTSDLGTVKGTKGSPELDSDSYAKTIWGL